MTRTILANYSKPLNPVAQPGGWHPLPNEINRPYATGHNKSGEPRELGRLHELWRSGGGRLLVAPDSRLPALLQQLAQNEPLIVAGGCYLFCSPLWGPIDLSRLNEGPQAYAGNVGQAELFRDLKIVVGGGRRLRIAGSEKHWGPQEVADRIYRENQWRNIPMGWAQLLWLHHRIDWSAYQGREGYDRFALGHFEGSSRKAWNGACSLLTDHEFARLEWGPLNKTNVRDVSSRPEASVNKEEILELRRSLNAAAEYLALWHDAVLALWPGGLPPAVTAYHQSLARIKEVNRHNADRRRCTQVPLAPFAGRLSDLEQAVKTELWHYLLSGMELTGGKVQAGAAEEFMLATLIEIAEDLKSLLFLFLFNDEPDQADLDVADPEIFPRLSQIITHLRNQGPRVVANVGFKGLIENIQLLVPG